MTRINPLRGDSDEQAEASARPPVELRTTCIVLTSSDDLPPFFAEKCIHAPVVLPFVTVSLSLSLSEHMNTHASSRHRAPRQGQEEEHAAFPVCFPLRAADVTDLSAHRSMRVLFSLSDVCVFACGAAF